MSDVLKFMSGLSPTSPLYTAMEGSLRVIEGALHLFPSPSEAAFSFNGGKDCTVVLHLIRAALHRRGSGSEGSTPHTFPRVVYFSASGTELQGEGGSAFPEALAFIRSCEAAYGFSVVELKGFKAGLASIVTPNDSVRGVFMGTRVGDPDAVQLLGPFTPTSPSWPPVMRVCPILNWSYGLVWQFLRGLGAPYCPLYDQGYTSLGAPSDCIPNPALLVVEGEGGGEVEAGGWKEGRVSPGGSQKHRPAWQLEDGELERLGRLKK